MGKIRSLCIMVALGLFMAGIPAMAINKVTIESITVTGGAVGVPVHVKVDNVDVLNEVVFPFEIRSASGGAFISSLKMQWAERLTSTLNAVKIAQLYAQSDGMCKDGLPGGYGTLTAYGANVVLPVLAPPEGGLMVKGLVDPNDPSDPPLQIGSDVSGSIVLTVDVLNTPGLIEIDTTCIDPGTHLFFVPNLYNALEASTVVPITPSFTKGVITVVPAQTPDFCFDPAVNYAAGTNPQSVFAADLDGDGDQDLAVANEGSNNVSVLKNNGNGTFPLPDDYAAGSGPRSVFAADLDGDGDLDLAVANNGSNNVSVLKNSGNATFAAANNYAVGTWPRSVFAADLDGDGDRDLAVADANTNRISVLQNNGNGTFAGAVNYPTGTFPQSVIAADLDGDGKPDLATADANTGGTVSILRNSWPTPGVLDFAIMASFVVGADPTAVYAADLDGDGDLDLATANNGSADASVLKNTSPGPGALGFTPAASYAEGPGPMSLVAADLNADGSQDLTLANVANNTVGVLKNNGNGTYAPPAGFSVGAQPVSVVAVDLDGDADLDLAVADYGGASVSILINCTPACDTICDTLLGNKRIGYTCEAGVKDLFDNVNGPESASPGTALQTYLSTCGGSPLTCAPPGPAPMFDCPAHNQCFGHTFTNCWDTSRCIVGATLCFQIAASGGVASNADEIILMEDGVPLWTLPLNILETISSGGTDVTWGSDDTLEYCLNLKALPASGVGPTNLLNSLEDGDLDVYIGKYTMVDYVKLTVEVCCSECFADGDINGDGTPLAVADAVALDRFVQGLGPAPIPLCRADMNGDGSIDQADVDRLKCYFIYGISCLPGYPIPTICDPDTVRGCCCVDTQCVVRSQANCQALGGTYMGDGTICCSCPHQGDINGDGVINVNDIIALIKIAFSNGPDVQDPLCPRTRGDVNGDGIVNVNDVLFLIKTAFMNGPPPIDPCL